MHLPSGTLLQGGKYKIITKIGQGGFGIVYKALHMGLQRDICIKEFFFSDYCERATNSTNVSVISTSAEKIQLVDSLRKKFTKEALRLAQFQNPHIIQVMDNFEENNTAYFVMEYLEGGSLEDIIEREGSMNEEKAIRLILPIIDALEAVHSIGLLHLDIKPSNIILRKNQSLVLIDFGISKYMETAQGNTTTAPIGISKGYAPLEQYGGTIANFSKATDVYSLCATLYKMVTGVTPPEPLQIMASGIKSPKELNSQLSVKFSNVILSGLHTKTTERPQTMGQLKSKLGNDNSTNETEMNSRANGSNSNLEATVLGKDLLNGTQANLILLILNFVFGFIIITSLTVRNYFQYDLITNNPIYDIAKNIYVRINSVPGQAISIQPVASIYLSVLMILLCIILVLVISRYFYFFYYHSKTNLGTSLICMNISLFICIRWSLDYSLERGDTFIPWVTLIILIILNILLILKTYRILSTKKYFDTHTSFWK